MQWIFNPVEFFISSIILLQNDNESSPQAYSLVHLFYYFQ